MQGLNMSFCPWNPIREIAAGAGLVLNRKKPAATELSPSPCLATPCACHENSSHLRQLFMKEKRLSGLYYMHFRITCSLFLSQHSRKAFLFILFLSVLNHILHNPFHKSFYAELNVKESDARVCDESSCKYGGICKEEGDGLKCACQFQVRIFHICYLIRLEILRYCEKSVSLRVWLI